MQIEIPDEETVRNITSPPTYVGVRFETVYFPACQPERSKREDPEKGCGTLNMAVMS